MTATLSPRQPPFIDRFSMSNISYRQAGATELSADQIGEKMMSSSKAGGDVPVHVRETADAIAALHSKHASTASAGERTLERLAAAISTSGFVLSVTAAVVFWLVANAVVLPWARHLPFDPSPYSLLQGVLTLLAVYISLSILTAQRRAGDLADLRAQLTLEHAILAEQKSSKAIALLEELRRDDPLIRDRHDHEAATMAKPADPEVVAEAIKIAKDLSSGE